MSERFKHSEFQQDDGQYQYYGIEDTEKGFVYNVIGKEVYDVSEESLIKLLNEQHERIAVLENEIMDFQELLTKEDTVCHERVFRLIDDYIWKWEDEGSPVADEMRKLKEELME